MYHSYDLNLNFDIVMIVHDIVDDILLKLLNDTSLE